MFEDNIFSFDFASAVKFRITQCEAFPGKSYESHHELCVT